MIAENEGYTSLESFTSRRFPRTFISQVITGYLLSLILQWFFILIPPVVIARYTMQGCIAFGQIQINAYIKVLRFTIWNIFFANVLSGSALYRVDVFLEPKNIPTVLAEAVPVHASFFMSYVVTSGRTSLSSDVFRIHFLGLLGITYFFLAPLILPFLLIYYFMGYIVYRNQLINVYTIKYETNGKYWPIVHTSIIFSLVLMHIIAIGIFGLNKLPIASGLMIPLSVLTLLFSQYCHKRVLQLFKAYPAECLIKKDHAEVGDPAINEFFDSLTTAYQDPSLMRSPYSSATDTHTSPLLATD